MTDATPDAVDPRFDPRFQRGYDPEQHGGGERHGGDERGGERRSALRSAAGASDHAGAPDASAVSSTTVPTRPASTPSTHAPFERPIGGTAPGASASAASVAPATRAASATPSRSALATPDSAPSHEDIPLHDDELDAAPRRWNPFLIAIPVISVALLGIALALFMRFLEQGGQSFSPGDETIDLAIQQATYLFPLGLVGAALLGLILWIALLAIRPPARARREPDAS